MAKHTNTIIVQHKQANDIHFGIHHIFLLIHVQEDKQFTCILSQVPRSFSKYPCIDIQCPSMQVKDINYLHRV